MTEQPWESNDHLAYAHMVMVPQQGETKRRRRRKKSKAESGSRKRKLSAEQVRLLEVNFGSEHKLESERKDRLASELGLDPRQVAVWFQNRRARWKNKRLEDDFSNLKALYDNLILDKCRLDSQVLQLKEQLCQAEEEIQRLSVPDRVGNSPTSSYSVDVTSIHQQQFFGMEEFSDVLYMPVDNCVYGVDQWINIYD